LIREIAQSLKDEGLLAAGADYETVDQLLDGLEGAAGRLAQTANTPPLDVASLRREWSDLRREAAKIPTPHLPSGDALRRSWEELKATAAAQDRPVFHDPDGPLGRGPYSGKPAVALALRQRSRAPHGSTHGWSPAGSLQRHPGGDPEYRICGVLGARIPAVFEGRRVAIFTAPGDVDGTDVETGVTGFGITQLA
jgi:hypothetical protein